LSWRSHKHSLIRCASNVEAPRGPDECKLIYCVTTGLDDRAIDDARRLLSSEEQVHCSSFRFDRHRRDYAVAHALLRRMVAERTGERPQDCQFVKTLGGKSFLSHDVGLSFSLSHTDGLVVCAFAEGCPIGVDAERVDREVDWNCISGQFFSPVDKSTLEACAADSRGECFVELWVLKEAFLKATGEGLTSLGEVGFAYHGSHGLRINTSLRADSAHWYVLLCSLQNYRLGLAVQGAGPHRVKVYSALDSTAALVSAELSLLRCSTPRDLASSSVRQVS
jgi:4'-phosphopantetheinyl transferase